MDKLLVAWGVEIDGFVPHPLCMQRCESFTNIVQCTDLPNSPRASFGIGPVSGWFGSYCRSWIDGRRTSRSPKGVRSRLGTLHCAACNCILASRIDSLICQCEAVTEGAQTTGWRIRMALSISQLNWDLWRLGICGQSGEGLPKP